MVYRKMKSSPLMATPYGNDIEAALSTSCLAPPVGMHIISFNYAQSIVCGHIVYSKRL